MTTNKLFESLEFDEFGAPEALPPFRVAELPGDVSQRIAGGGGGQCSMQAHHVRG